MWQSSSWILETRSMQSLGCILVCAVVIAYANLCALQTTKQCYKFSSNIWVPFKQWLNCTPFCADIYPTCCSALHIKRVSTLWFPFSRRLLLNEFCSQYSSLYVKMPFYTELFFTINNAWLAFALSPFLKCFLVFGACASCIFKSFMKFAKRCWVIIPLRTFLSLHVCLPPCWRPH